MRLYFEFEDQRRLAEVTWPKHGDTVSVHLQDKSLQADFPADLLYDIVDGNKINFVKEDAYNERLVELQSIIAGRLQEIVAK